MIDDDENIGKVVNNGVLRNDKDDADDGTDSGEESSCDECFVIEAC